MENKSVFFLIPCLGMMNIRVHCQLILLKQLSQQAFAFCFSRETTDDGAGIGHLSHT